MSEGLRLQAEIFRQAGFASGQESTGISVFLGFFKLVATGASACITYLAPPEDSSPKLC